MLRSDVIPRVLNMTKNSGDARIIPDMSVLEALFGIGASSPRRTPEFRQVLICCHTILILCGTTFNLAVLFALIYFKEQTFRNIANTFVFTLTASDVVLCGISMPIQLYYGIDEKSFVNTALCRTPFVGFGIPMYVSCLTILLISVDRRRLAVKPTVPRVFIRTTLCLIHRTVVFFALNTAPVGVYTESRRMEGSRNYCVEAWPKPVFRLVYSVATLTIHFFLPMFVSGGLYLGVYRRLTIRPQQLSVSKELGQ
ncbi:Neuropeptide Y receptor type 2 [Taenia solium]|eukprot:TsM_000020300 transcript=TsM_000020300 gene=TsM_000020300